MPRIPVESMQSGRQAVSSRGLWSVGLVTAFLGAVVLLVGQSPVSVRSQTQFADPAFRAMWDRSDGPVAAGAVLRPWVWGPVPGRSLGEAFQGIPGNSHSVQYFDKGRMEINNPAANKDDPFYVTNGLLAVELISGLQQTGVASYQNRRPAAINLASDVDDPSAPTYQSFNGVSNVPGAPNKRTANDATGTLVRTAIDRLGRTQPWPQDHPDYGVRIARYEPVTGHNIPDVFWEYLNQQTTIIQNGQRVRGPLFYPWFSVTGYPISEPYWSYVKVEGRYTDVLTQAYERRVLTFVPHFQVPFKVQMGNIGMHYYDWRYLNAGAGGGGAGPATPTAQALPPRASVRITTITYRKSLVDLNGNAVVLNNAGQAAVSLNGWWIDSPKWDHVDRFYFPNGIVMAPGASLTVHAGPGRNTATDIYMSRTTVMWEGQPYDLAVLYDNYGREVSRYFPAAETGAPPTPPGVTATTVPAGTPTPPKEGTPGATSTPTVAIPSPLATAVTPLATATAATPTATARTTTATSTTTRTPTRTPTP